MKKLKRTLVGFVAAAGIVLAANFIQRYGTL